MSKHGVGACAWKRLHPRWFSAWPFRFFQHGRPSTAYIYGDVASDGTFTGTDGSLDIGFTASANNPPINGIVVIPE